MILVELIFLSKFNNGPQARYGRSSQMMDHSFNVTQSTSEGDYSYSFIAFI